MHIEWRDWQLNGIYARIKSVLLGWVAYHNKEGIGRQIVKELRIIVAGSRDFKNYRLLSDTIMEYLGSMDDTDLINSPSQVKFISGNAKGADVLGEQFAYTRGYDVVRFPADWGRTRKEIWLCKKCQNGRVCYGRWKLWCTYCVLGW